MIVMAAALLTEALGGLAEVEAWCNNFLDPPVNCISRIVIAVHQISALAAELSLSATALSCHNQQLIEANNLIELTVAAQCPLRTMPSSSFRLVMQKCGMDLVRGTLAASCRSLHDRVLSARAERCWGSEEVFLVQLDGAATVETWSRWTCAWKVHRLLNMYCHQLDLQTLTVPHF